MLWVAVFLALSLSRPACEALATETKVSTQKPRKAIPKAMTLDAFIEKVVAGGSPTHFSELICEILDMPRIDLPARIVVVSEDQTEDKANHDFQILYDKFDDGPINPAALRRERIYPWPKHPERIGIALSTSYEWPGNDESYLFRVSLNGKLEKAVVIHGKRDEQGNSIKGSGVTTEKDINSPEIQERFQHELDLWLKKTYLKKEWRSAEFLEGDLKKKGVKSASAGKKGQTR